MLRCFVLAPLPLAEMHGAMSVVLESSAAWVRNCLVLRWSADC
jgi:hypothetical protein